jgi:hypothetical protein
MKRFVIAAALAVAFGLGTASQANAQYVTRFTTMPNGSMMPNGMMMGTNMSMGMPQSFNTGMVRAPMLSGVRFEPQARSNNSFNNSFNNFNRGFQNPGMSLGPRSGFRRR